MARLLLTLLVLLSLTGCPDQNTAPTAEQIAAYQAELKQAQSGKAFWQSTATVLSIIVLLALAAGMVLGSKARKDSDE